MSLEEIRPTTLVGIKRLAKHLKAELNITYLRALDQAAKRAGFENFRHASNRLKDEPFAVGQTLSAFALTCEQFPGGMEGVFIVRLSLRDTTTRERLTNVALRFDLPERTGWHFRPATNPQNVFAPYLDGRQRMLQGVFVDGAWMAILSRNGVQDHEYAAHLATLPWMLQAIEVLASEALDTFLGETRGDVRLFFTAATPGVTQLRSLRFRDLASAQQARLPKGMTPFAISDQGSWITYGAGWGVDAKPTIRHAVH